jgi:hypothetical protein
VWVRVPPSLLFFGKRRKRHSIPINNIGMKGKWTKINWQEKKEEILNWIQESNYTISKCELCLRLNVRIATLNTNLKKIGIDYDGNMSSKGVRTLTNDNIFITNSPAPNSRVRARILSDNLLEYKCNECGIIDTWNNKSINLQLDHINGIRNDNRLINLRWLCPNCHSQTSTFCSKNRNTNKSEVSEEELLDSLKRNNNIVDRVFRELGLAGAGNYKRIYKLIAKYNLTEGRTFTHQIENKQFYYKN